VQADKLLKPGPIILTIWLTCYLMWVFFLPYKWVLAIRKFLFENQLEMQIYKSLVGLHPESTSFPSTPEGFPIFAIVLIFVFAVAFAAGVSWLRFRLLRDLFS
jgi:hypothetical protein